jgi:hypothetical protein
LVVHVLQAYLTSLGYQIYIAPVPPNNICALKLSEDQLAKFSQLRADYRHLRMDIQQPDALAMVHDKSSFDQYTTYLVDLLSDSNFCFSRSRQESIDDEENLVKQWLDLADKMDIPSRDPMLRRPMTYQPGNNDDPTGNLLHAITRAWLYESTSWKDINFPFNRRPVPNDELSDQQLDQLDRIFTAVGKRRQQSFMLAAEAGHNWVAKAQWEHARRGMPAPVRRFPESLSAAVTPTRGQTVAHQAQQNTSAGAGVFWKEARTLLDVISTKQSVRTIRDPVVFNGMVYCIAFSKNPDGPALEILKFDPLTGKSSVLGSHVSDRYGGCVEPRPGTVHDRLSEKSYFCQGFIADGNYVVIGPDSMSLLIFPLCGGNPTILDQQNGLPWPFMQSATMLGGKIYAKVRDGMLIELDPASHQYQTLASSERKEHLTPFDDSPPFDVPVMLSDPQHQRIVLFAASPRWPLSRCGLYEFNVKTRAFRRLMGNDKTDPATTQPTGRLAAGATVVHWGTDTLISMNVGDFTGAFDLEKNKAVDIPWQNIPGTINDTVSTEWPHAPQGPWIWTAVDLGKRFSGHAGLARIDTEKKRLQIFPPIRPVEIAEGMWPVYLQQIDDQRMLIGDQYGLWVVAPPEGFASPDSVLDEAAGGTTALVPPPSGAQLPWDSGKTLYDYLLQPGGYDFVARPLVAGKFVYAVGLGHSGSDDRPTQAFARLLKFNIADGSMNELGAITMTSPAWPTQVFLDTQQGVHHGDRIKSSDNFVSATVLTDDRLYCQTNSGLMDFPLEGPPGKMVSPKTPLPPGWGASIAYLDGHLYLAGSASKVIQVFDPGTNTVESVPADANPKPAPFDTETVRVPFVCADSKQHRLIFIACDSSRQCKAGGVWEYNPASKQFSKLLPLYLNTAGRSLDWPGRSVGFIWANLADQQTLMICTSRGFLSFDIHTNTLKRIQQTYSDIDVLAATSQPTQMPAEAAENDLLAGSISLNAPVAFDDKWLWSGFPWSRVSRDGKTWQSFPPLRPGDINFVPTESIQLFDNGRHLLIADSMACWVLNLQTQAP